MFENEETIPIFTADDSVQEVAVCAALDEAGIKYLVVPFEDHAYDGLFTRVFGFSRVCVFQRDAERALEVIQPIVARFREPENEDTSGES
jgi:hypothetical protein